MQFRDEYDRNFEMCRPFPQPGSQLQCDEKMAREEGKGFTGDGVIVRVL